jgi:transcriptional regulator with XRE-family HTH domain
MEKKVVGQRLKTFADLTGITQYRLAKDTGVAQSAFTRFFNGTGDPSAEVLAKIVEVYPSLNIRWLLTGKGEMLEKSAAMEVSVNA